MVRSKVTRHTVRRKRPQDQLASLRQQLRELRADRLKHVRSERSLHKKIEAQTKELADHKLKMKQLLDWALQSLYAVGLGLEASRSLLEINPRQAVQDLELSIGQLNSLIEGFRARLTS